jgi:hypothetical protein
MRVYSKVGSGGFPGKAAPAVAQVPWEGQKARCEEALGSLLP